MLRYCIVHTGAARCYVTADTTQVCVCVCLHLRRLSLGFVNLKCKPKSCENDCHNHQPPRVWTREREKKIPDQLAAPHLEQQ